MLVLSKWFSDDLQKYVLNFFEVFFSRMIHSFAGNYDSSADPVVHSLLINLCEKAERIIQISVKVELVSSHSKAPTQRRRLTITSTFECVSF